MVGLGRDEPDPIADTEIDRHVEHALHLGRAAGPARAADDDEPEVVPAAPAPAAVALTPLG